MQKIWYIILIRIPKVADAEPNRFRANIGLPAATIANFDQVLRWKGDKGGLLIILCIYLTLVFENLNAVHVHVRH